jgi:ABC-2 type transport system ATP-binding protein
MDEHARTVRVRVSDNRVMASALVATPEVVSIRIDQERDALIVESHDVRAVYHQIPRIARKFGLRLFEVAAVDDSLSSVFAYVTERR